jgi:succinylglutamate desuccinylase
MKHYLGSYTGYARGALVIVTGGIHGNEPAGVQAVEAVLRMLEQAQTVHPDFRFNGKFIGLAGHPEALAQGTRFLERDLNRLWTPEHAALVSGVAPALLSVEDRLMAGLLDLIRQEIHDYKPETLVLLDLHTTSADGGIFSFPTDDISSRQLAEALGAPVILDMLDGINGTLLQYVAGHHFNNGIYPHHSLGCAFEGGKHDDPESVNRCVAAIVRCLRACGCIGGTEHIDLLETGSKHLPKVTHLLYVHAIKPEYQFRMRPGYRNFQPVVQGEHLADDRNGAVPAPMDGYIVMPLYQPTGSDGFFIVGNKI